MGMRKWGLVVLALVLALGFTSAALGEANQAGGTEIAIQYGGKAVVGRLGSVGMDEQRGLMGASFYCADLQDHIKLEVEGDGMSITVPIDARIRVDGEMLKPVDGTFFRDEAFWFFDTDKLPDIVTFHPHGDEDPANAVMVDAASGIILGEAPAAAAPATAEPEADMPSAGDSDIAALLDELAEAAADPWERAIYRAGAEEVSRDGEAITFALRSFDPKLSSLPSYGEDEQAWRDALFGHVRAHNLEVTLTLQDGEPDEAGLKSLNSAVAAAAKSAKSAFDQKAVRVALADLLLPTPVEDDKSANGWGELNHEYHELVSTNGAFDGLDSVKLTPLFYAQSKQSLSVKDGPHALALNCTGADPAALIESARKSLMDRLSKVYKANDMEDDEIDEAFANALAEKAAAIRKGGGEAHTFALDIDALMDGDFGADYAAYMQAFDPETALAELIYEVQALPDAPAQDFPKSGRISGSKSGTKVIINAPSDDLGRYVQMRGTDDDEMAVALFIRSGSSATVYVPKGMYYLLVASGENWYGTEGLFGDSGGYSRTDEVEILSSRYYHTLTLNAGEGDISMYGTNPSAFQ